MSRPVRLSIVTPTEDLPRVVRAYRRTRAGEQALVLRPVEGRALVVDLPRSGSPKVWRSWAPDRPPGVASQATVLRDEGPVQLRVESGALTGAVVSPRQSLPDWVGHGATVDVLVHRDEHADVLVGGFDGDVPQSAVTEDLATKAVAMVRGEQLRPGAVGPRTLRGRWSGTCRFDPDGPRLALTRTLTSYGVLSVTSDPFLGWSWVLRARGQLVRSRARDERSRLRAPHGRRGGWRDRRDGAGPAGMRGAGHPTARGLRPAVGGAASAAAACPDEGPDGRAVVERTGAHSRGSDPEGAARQAEASSSPQARTEAPTTPDWAHRDPESAGHERQGPGAARGVPACARHRTETRMTGVEARLARIVAHLETALPSGLTSEDLEGFVDRHRTTLLEIIADTMPETSEGTARNPERRSDVGAASRAPDAPTVRSRTEDPSPTEAALPTTVARRTEANLAAMALLAEKSDAPWTHPEREILARYTGWGGLSLDRVRGRIPEGVPVPDSKALLHEYYTPVEVTDEVARLVRPLVPELANEDGVVPALEPSAGVGRFVQSLSGTGFEALRWSLVEAAPVAARILEARFGDRSEVREVWAGTFESWLRSRGTQQTGVMRLVVANPPYGPRGAALTVDPDRAYREKQASAYFLRRGLDLLGGGGLGVFLIPAGFLTGRSAAAEGSATQGAAPTSPGDRVPPALRALPGRAPGHRPAVLPSPRATARGCAPERPARPRWRVLHDLPRSHPRDRGEGRGRLGPQSALRLPGARRLHRPAGRRRAPARRGGRCRLLGRGLRRRPRRRHGPSRAPMALRLPLRKPLHSASVSNATSPRRRGPTRLSPLSSGPSSTRRSRPGWRRTELRPVIADCGRRVRRARPR